MRRNSISDAIDLVEEITLNLGKNLKIKGVEQRGITRWRLYLEDVLWVKVEDAVTFNAYEFTGIVLSVGCDYIEIDYFAEPESGFETPYGTINLREGIKFMHGTVTGVNNEMIGINDSREYTPLVYFIEQTSGTGNLDKRKNVDFSTPARILILVEARFKDNEKSDDFYDNYILKTEKITNELIEKLQEHRKTATNLGTYTIYNHIKAGYHTKNGAELNLFAVEMSGTELRIDITLLKKDCC